MNAYKIFTLLMVGLCVFCALACALNAAWRRGLRCGRAITLRTLRRRRTAKAARKKAAADALTDAQMRRGMQLAARDEKFRASMRRAQLTLVKS